MTDTDPTPPAPQAIPDESMVSVQSQIGLLVAAILTVLAFIFHKDLSSLTAPLSLIGFAVYGAAIAIARAIKHRTVAQATMMHNQQRLDAWAITQDQTHTEQRLRAIEARLPTPRKTTTRSRPR